MERSIELTLTAEVAGALVVLRQADETLEQTASRVLLEARQALRKTQDTATSDESASQEG